MIPLSAVGVLLFVKIAADRGRKQQEELSIQFRECILAVSTSLQAGYSVENAFVECRQDMAFLYGEKGLIVEEMDIVRRGLNINISLEELLQDMAMRSGCEEIAQFAQIFSIVKRNGGNMAAVIQSTADQIGRRIELKREIKMFLGGKKMEMGIMRIMPFGILLYVDMGTPGYFDSLYHNFTGTAIMTVCLLIYLTAYFLGEWIMKGLG